MISRIQSCGISGIDGYIVHVEGDVSSGLPAFDIVGLPDAAVKESKERVRSAIQNCGFEFPLSRVTINLAPGNIKKEGPIFDLPIAIAVLFASAQLSNIQTKEYMFLGELSLNGELREINGALSMASAAKNNGFKNIILPIQNAQEAGVVNGINVFGARDLFEVINHLTGEKKIAPTIVDMDLLFGQSNIKCEDFSDVKGQDSVKRALEVAAAGGHNCIMIGTPGSGKTMLAQRLPSILPELTIDEALEVTKIHSTAGVLPPNTALITNRQFRSPHHTISTTSLTGGGKTPKPGEISLAHNGVLFLDELPEFKKEALEVLRQPLEDGRVTIARVNATITYPCSIMLVASMNPCKCGYFGDPSRRCTCSVASIQKYLSRISGPMLDRIDIHIDVSPVKYDELSGNSHTEGSLEIRKRVNTARHIQVQRYKGTGIYSNAQLTPSMLGRYCRLGDAEKALLKAAFDKLGLSARAWGRILKVSRTIADLEGAEHIQTGHIAEAIQYRSLDRKFWG